MSLEGITEACIKAFLPNFGSVEDVLKLHDVSVIDGKSAIKKDEEINNKRRTFGFYWNRKVRIHN